MMLVLLQHADAPGSTYILQFHMPAFFLLSGYTEYQINHHQSFIAHIKSRFTRLLIPYFLFEMINCNLYGLVYYVSQSGLPLIDSSLPFHFKDAIISVFLCLNSPYKGLYGRLWFLPAMFFSSIFVYSIRKMMSKSISAQWLSTSVLFFLSYYTSSILSNRLPFGIDIALLGSAFMMLGLLCGPYIEFILHPNHHKLDYALLLISVGLFSIINVTHEPLCLMYKNVYTDYVAMVVAALSGTLFFLILCYLVHPLLQKVPFIYQMIVWYSINSLITFPIHLTIKIGSIVILNYLGCSSWLLLFTLMLTINIPISNFITLYCPFMLGKIANRHNTVTRSKAS